MSAPTANIALGKSILNELLPRLGSSEFSIYEDQLESRQILAISADNHPVLIGRRGENLQALQMLLNSLIKHQDPLSEYITIDIANYKKDRIEQVMRLAEDAAQRVIEYGKDYELRPMTAFERRIAHMVLADKPELTTESVGEDPHRKVIIKLK